MEAPQVGEDVLGGGVVAQVGGDGEALGGVAFAAPGHVLYGSDHPMLAEEWGAGFDAELDRYPRWEPGQLHAVDRGNAERLFPRLTRR
ncbi:hypothetical protein E1265_11445 [Streptomyces sp. 8K308]|uniref:amidohydrolase family protein n=1 Tax=Streptomyces sp. 8K308 TaxID=2530388 RepID=UPI001048D0F6|nr:amidohydrolase family protein [Streptomyces sp. 8K308]TDC23931.1 hypothetical protein E1265_11445 [Streptomyces sp. 8K308]